MKLRKIIAACFTLLMGLALLEGLTSLGLFVWDLATRAEQPSVQRRHTQYDQQIGWISIPNQRYEDIYGPDATLTTNSLGARGREKYSPKVPEDRVRIICSGDYDTLGYGVGDDQTWCHLLEVNQPRIETVNLGQGGYGIDQSYLWSLRAAAALEYDIHLVALNEDQFKRMQTDEVDGYGKPVIHLRGSKLEVDNLPVPKRGYYSPWLTQNASILRELGIVRAMERAEVAMDHKKPDALRLDQQAMLNSALGVFQALEQNADKNNALVVYAYLPQEADYDQEKLGQENWLRPWLRDEANQRGLNYIDLTEDLSQLPAERLPELFLTTTEATGRKSDEYYSVAGHRWLAGALFKRLQALPEVGERLE